MSAFLRAAARLLRGLRPAPEPAGFAEQLAAAIGREPGVMLRVTAFERSLAARPRDARRSDSTNH